MRKTITITTKRKGGDGETDIRLFSMNDRQMNLYMASIIALHKVSGKPIPTCAREVEAAVVKLLAGQMPVENAPRIFIDLRIAFPTLKGKDVRMLPRAGCPQGRLTALVLGIRIGETREQRNVLIEFDDDQTDFYNDAIYEIRKRDNCTKDDAWLWVNNLVGQLMAGGTLKEKTEEILLMRAINLFPAITKDEAAQLPLATEDDVRRHSFTMDRAR